MEPSFHLAGFGASVAASQTDSSLTPFVDSVLTIGTSGILLPDNMYIARTYGQGLGLTQYRINVPSLRTISLPRIGVVNKAASPVDDAPIQVFGEMGPGILQSEGYNNQVTTDATAGPNFTTVFQWLTKGFKPVTRGRLTTIRATTTITAVAGSWVAGNLTLEQDLPSGVYEIVGCDAFGTGLHALRFAFPGGGLRPGVLCQQAAGEFLLQNQRYGAMGSFGTFQNSLPPTVEITGIAGAIACTVFIDIIKVR